MDIHNEINVVAFNGGDRKEFDKVVIEHQNKLFFYALSIVKRKDVAEDIVQVAFLKLHKEENKAFVSEDSIKNFLYTIVKHDSFNFIKAKQVRDTYAQDFRYRHQDDQEKSALNIMVDAEVTRQCYDNIDLLPPICREICDLHFRQSLKPADIADRLNISIGNVRQQISLGVKRLRELIKK